MLTTVMSSDTLEVPLILLERALHLVKARYGKEVERVDNLIDGAGHFRRGLPWRLVPKNQDSARPFMQLGRLVPGDVGTIREQNLCLGR
jgi:hypothetical protein